LVDSKAHIIDLPRKVVIGKDTIYDIKKYFRELLGQTRPGTKVIVVTGERVSVLYFPVVRDGLEEAGYSVERIIVREPSVDEAERVLRHVAEASSDTEVIVGLGGGKSIDIAKYVSSKLNKTFVSIPTVASHDGITSPFASLRGFGRPLSKLARAPSMILIDVSIIANAPPRYNKAGFGDIIGKYTAVRDWRLAHRLKGEYYGGYAASLALMSAKHVPRHVDDIAAGTEEGLRVLLEALVSSGVAMCIAGSTRPASGSEHLFAHAVTMLVDNPPLHGELVGVGTIMMSYLHGLNWRKIRRMLERLDMPTTASELGLDEEVIVKALTMAASIRPERYTILGEKGLTEEAARRLVRVTGVVA